MKRYLFYFAFVSCALSIKAQDTIIMRDATRIEVKVLEITNTEVAYKKWSYQDGPTFRIDVDRVYNIIFANGETYYDHPVLVSEQLTNYVYDIDGNVYNAVRIGNQIWMASNLRTRHFLDGSEISSKFASVVDPKCYDIWPYDKNDSDIENVKREDVGLYYNFAATKDKRGLCPQGWHVPSYDEWRFLTDYLEGLNEAQLGGVSVAKSLASQNGWLLDNGKGKIGDNPSSNNTVFFSAFPAGYIFHGKKIIDYSKKACFWSSTEVMNLDQFADAFFLEYDDDDDGFELCRRFRDCGFSVRCIKNN